MTPRIDGKHTNIFCLKPVSKPCASGLLRYKCKPTTRIIHANAVHHFILDSGRPQLRHTLSSLALVGEELWLESTDQLREDKFYRFNQTLQELLNLASKVPA